MLLQIVIYLLAIACVFVLLVGVGVVVYYCVAVRKFAGRLDNVAHDLEVYLEARKAELGVDGHVDADCIPPMRIHLEPFRGSGSWLGQSGAQCSHWLEEHGFELVGDFVIEEVRHEKLRAFLSTDRTMIASLRRPLDAREPYLEFCFQLANGESCGVANPPEATLPLSEEAIGQFFDGVLSEQPELAGQMHVAASQLSGQHPLVEFERAGVPLFYEEAHAKEMDLRLSNGGVSVEEITQSLAAQGIEPTRSEIERIQAQWQKAIEKHLLDFSSQGLNEVFSGQQVMIVYDGSVEDYLVGKLKDILQDLATMGLVSRLEIDASLQELRELLGSFTPREAVARFRPLLPQNVRYQLIDQLKHPLEADLYVLPNRSPAH